MAELVDALVLGTNSANCEGSSPFSPTINIMKVTLENSKGLNKDFKISIDKKTMSSYMDEKYDEVKKNIVLKGFRPGKVPKEILQKQFGKQILSEVLDKVLRESSMKALEEKKIKPIGQPKIDLKTFGEDKDLEYIISVTEYPKIDLQQIEKIKFDDYSVKVEDKEVEKRVELIAAHQNKFIDTEDQTKSKEGDLVTFDYKATVNGKDFKGNEGKNTQLVLGKDLFIKGFDKQLIGCKKNDNINVEANLPENFPEKDFQNKKAVFSCKILSVKHKQDSKIDDEFAKSVGAKDLNNLKEMVSKQVSEELINSLNMITSKQIIKQIEKFKIEDLPKNILDEEFKILTQGMKEEDIKKNKKNLEDQAKSRIKTGLIMNEYGEKNKITVTDQELQNEIQKQLRMMPGQEKMVQEYYQKNPSILANLRGSLYEEKIIKSIKDKAKGNKKNISKEQAEKIIKEENDSNQNKVSTKKTSSETAKVSEKSKKKPQKKSTSKKVSKK